jgi:DNA processing protein
MSLRTGTSEIRLDDRQRFDWLRLIRSENVGPRTFRALLNQYGGASAALAALPGLTRKGGKPIRIASVEEVEKELDVARKLGVRFIAMGESAYPAPLREIVDPPPMIAARGSLETLRRPTAAIVGSRNASALGLAMTEKLATGLGMAGYVVASGLARGVDAVAHRASLKTGTIAVLAGGLANIYPHDHVDLAEDIAAQGGAVLSEMPIGWEARGRDFPRRNRIVSGLSSAVVIVEAVRRSGSLITARFAAEQGREVFAVPGHPLDPRAEGPNDLIAQGAQMCRSAEELVAALEAMRGTPKRDLFEEDRPTALTQSLWDELDLVEPAPSASFDFEFDETAPAPLAADARGAEATLLSLLGPSPIACDDLFRMAGLPAATARAALFELELKSEIVRDEAGGVSRAV